MQVKKKEFSPLSVLTDEEFLIEAGQRLREIYHKKSSKELNYGVLNFIYWGGETVRVQEEKGQTLFKQMVEPRTPLTGA